MDQAKVLNETTEAWRGLFAKFDVEVGNWPMLALKLAIDGGHLKARIPNGRVHGSPKDRLLIWARVQKKLDAKPCLPISRACREAGVSRPAYYRARECEFVLEFEKIRAKVGPDVFWASFDIERWKAGARRIDAKARRLMQDRVNLQPTLLGLETPRLSR